MWIKCAGINNKNSIAMIKEGIFLVGSRSGSRRGKRKWKEDGGRSGRHERKRMHMLIIIKIHILIVAAHEIAVYQRRKSVKHAVYKMQGVPPLVLCSL
jgi:hypothetical protein